MVAGPFGLNERVAAMKLKVRKVKGFWRIYFVYGSYEAELNYFTTWDEAYIVARMVVWV